ncbi:uncharacterized protein MONBRDRAFT_34097 [Monosiga brevicollis MX1]|uniref:Uncharacterized protein n=1 Tax=Monosiga brevicollis TaxID=81824 RepID=A9V9K8_MONBE|nr:uncharacterized protein MONBRDRAFT_34097 [Monosiga brevicollis MX1]EDQ85685.1 predicted protein [Monosiga brevicollis MX1]|eukprot:XP_001749400.1 hypothetical protein [Monosiga brevicollis MX1]
MGHPEEAGVAEPLLAIPEDNVVVHRSSDRSVVGFLYFLFFLEGIGSLFPWNAFITVTSYFDDVLAGTNYASSYENYFSFSFQGASIIFILLAMRYKQRINVHTRILAPLVIEVIVFSSVTVISKIPGLSTNAFMSITIGQTVAAGAAGAFLQSGLFGLAGVMPEAYVHALMNGQALGGVIVAGLNLVSLGVSGTSQPREAAFLFFILSVVVLLCCFVGYVLLMRHPLVISNLEKADAARIASTQASPRKNPDMSSSVNQTKRDRKSLKRYRSYLHSEDGAILSPFRKAWLPCVMVFCVFWITLSIFPAISASVSSTSPYEEWRSWFVPVCVFFLFNFGDLIGRLLTWWKPWPETANYRKLPIPVLARVLFVPLFALCNVANADYVLFKNDAFPALFMLAVGISNGYLGTMCMMIAPSLVPPGDAESVGQFSVLLLNLGLLSGSLTGFGLKAAICKCNPFK